MLIPFSPPPGINSDATTFSAEGQWADGDNVRFEGGKPRPVGGADAKFTISGAHPVLDIFAFTRSGSNTFAYGTAQSTASLFVGTGLTSATARTPAGSPASSNGWSFAPWGDTLLAAIRGGTLYEQSAASAATEVTQAPNRIDAGIIVTPERQVIAFSCNEELSGTHNALCVRWCDIEDYTDWTTSATNNAGEHVLQGPGAIVAAKQIGAYIAILTTTSLYLGQFIGDPSQTYRFDRVSESCGPLSARAVTELGGVLYWMGQDFLLRAWAPGAPVQVIPNTGQMDFSTNAVSVAGQSKSFIMPHPHREEVWFFYYDGRDASSSYPTRYIAYSIRESIAAERPVWFKGQLARSAAIASEIIRAELASVDSGVLAALLSANSSGQVSILDTGNGIQNGYIQSADQYIDKSQRRMMIKGFHPDFEDLMSDGAPDLNLTLFVRNHPQSGAVTKGPYNFTTATTKKDFRASGKIMAVKITDNGGNSMYRMGTPLFDVIPMGER